MDFEVNLGGGPKNGSCVARALAIVTNYTYEDVYKSLRAGTRIRSLLEPSGYIWTETNTDFREYQFPLRSCFCVLNCKHTDSKEPYRHYTSVICGILYDEYNILEVWKYLNLVGYWSQI